MEESVCRVTLGNITKEYKKGTTYSEIAREFQPDYEHQIVGNGRWLSSSGVTEDS